MESSPTIPIIVCFGCCWELLPRAGEVGCGWGQSWRFSYSFFACLYPLFTPALCHPHSQPQGTFVNYERSGKAWPARPVHDVLLDVFHSCIVGTS